MPSGTSKFSSGEPYHLLSQRTITKNFTPSLVFPENSVLLSRLKFLSDIGQRKHHITFGKKNRKNQKQNKQTKQKQKKKKKKNPNKQRNKNKNNNKKLIKKEI